MKGGNSMAKKDAMPKVVKLYKDDIVDNLEELLAKAKKGEIINFIACGSLKDGNMFSVMVNTSIVENHTLISFLQTMCIARTIAVSYDSDEE